MNHIKNAKAESHSYFGGSVKVIEFNFQDDRSINDAFICIEDRYPLSGYAVNDVSTALVSIESGSGIIEIMDSITTVLEAGDRLLIKPGEAYAFIESDKLAVRYIATPAWIAEQSRIIEG